jgi:hypothetical protein
MRKFMIILRHFTRGIIFGGYLIFSCFQKGYSPAILFRLNKPFQYGGSFTGKYEIYKCISFEFVPPTLLILSHTPKKEKEVFFKENIGPYILKPNQGHQGIGTFLLEKVSRFNSLPPNYILQKYIPHQKELGIFFINGKIDGIGEKVRRNNELYTTLVNTYYTPANQFFTKAVIETFTKLLKKIPSDYGRFDILVANEELFVKEGKGFYIAEVNFGIDTSPIHVIDHKKTFWFHLKKEFEYAEKAIDLAISKKPSNENIFSYFKELFFYIRSLKKSTKSIRKYTKIRQV